MSLGANLSSGYTEQILRDTLQCSASRSIANDAALCLVTTTSGQGPSAVYSSMRLSEKSKQCPAPTPADFAKYPKVAVPSSVLTQARSTKQIQDRFSQYTRYQPPVPCPVTRQPTSLPSVRQCPLYFITTH